MPTHFWLAQATSLFRSRLTDVSTRSALPRFLGLYAGLFGAFGVASPFLPGLLNQDGLDASAIGIVLAAGTAIRLLAGPIGGRLADRMQRPSLVLTGFTAAAALVALGYVPARGLPLLILVSVCHAAVLAPLTPIADALALGSSSSGRGFAYGWVRGAGSAAFIAGTLLSGQLVERAGLGTIIWLNAGFLAAAAVIALRVPNRLAGGSSMAAIPSGLGPWRALFGVPAFTRLMIVAALIGGSHALHDGFEVIRWRTAGLSASQCSVLWSLSVAAEVVVFLFAGRPLINRLGAAGATTLSAAAGVVRWSTAANTASFPIMALVEPLHGLTFALLHLACMDVIGRSVPTALAATAQAFYATIAMGATAALVTLASGPLYGHFGAAAFWAMAAMCGMAIPVAIGLPRIS
jgi:PPP family 3-phenylpropionic acid transporter